jgi:hypothetical protein
VGEARTIPENIPNCVSRKSVIEGYFAEVVVAAGGSAVTCAHVDFQSRGIAVGFSVRSFATYFAGPNT